VGQRRAIDIRLSGVSEGTQRDQEALDSNELADHHCREEDSAHDSLV
jgi:hypothetical protein